MISTPRILGRLFANLTRRRNLYIRIPPFKKSFHDDAVDDEVNKIWLFRDGMSLGMHQKIFYFCSNDENFGKAAFVKLDRRLV